MLAALKGLPFAYNRDLIEDKKAAFEAVDTLALVLPAMSGMVQTMRVNVDVLARQASEGFTLATEVADWLARKGVPFSEAHEITGALVRRCEDKGIGLADASDADLAAIDPRLDGGLRRPSRPRPRSRPAAAMAARRLIACASRWRGCAASSTSSAAGPPPMTGRAPRAR